MKLKLAALSFAMFATCGAFAQATDTVAKVKASGVVTMGVRDSSGALSYTLGDGKYTGFHIEVCNKIIANLEKAAGRKLEVKYQPVTSQNRIQTLRKNERASNIDFKEVFGKDHSDSFLLLESGRAEAFVMDGAILAGNIAIAKNPADFKLVGEVLSVEPIAIMIRKDDTAFKKVGDDTVKEMMKSGEMAKLWDKWFLQPIPPKNTRVGYAASESTKAAWANPNDKPMEDYAKK